VQPQLQRAVSGHKAKKFAQPKSKFQAKNSPHHCDCSFWLRKSRVHITKRSVEGLCQGKSTHAWRFMPQCCTCRPGIWRHSLNHGFEVRFGVQRTWLWRIYNQPRWTINRWSSIWSGNNCRQSKLFFLLIKRAFIDVCHPCPSLSPRRHSFLFCEIVACNY